MDTTENLSLGQQLKNAREAFNLSTEEVAQKTNLKRSHIELLESDIFILQNVPPAFVRGYVRNYVRFLCLPETLVNSVNYGEVTIPKEVKRVTPIKVHNHKSQMRWVKLLTWLILLSAIGMTLAWWWQEHKKDEASRDQFVTTTETNAVPLSTESNPQPIAIEPATTANNEANVANNDVAINTVPNQAGAATEPAQTAVTTVEQPNVATQAQQTEEAVSTPATVVPETSEPVNVLAQTNDNQPTQVAEQPMVIGNDELRIEITGGQSWITVKSLKGKRLAEKLYNAGEVLTFNANEPYRLTVGAPANVKIYYKGQEVPLKVDGRVARFKLPLAN